MLTSSITVLTSQAGLDMNKENRYLIAKKVTLVGAAMNALLGIIKVITGILFHSHALAADGIHSFADLITDAMVLFGSKYGSQNADETHPYGHQRIETATTLFLSLVLILTGAGIAWDAIDEIIYKSHTIPQFLALPIAIISILANEGLFHYTRSIGTKIKSELIIANAWHRRSDAASSFVVVMGLLGSFMGYAGFDAIAAVVVSIMIIKMGWDYGWNSVKELVDTAIDTETRLQIETITKNIDGVVKIHQLRSRSMAGDVFVDLHIQVSPWISVSEGHFIAQHVHQSLMDHITAIKDVTVHVDPEDDEASSPCLHLPNRTILETTLLLPWKNQYPEIQYWNLNYLDGFLTIDLYCKEPISPALLEHIQENLKQYPIITNVRLFKLHFSIQENLT